MVQINEGAITNKIVFNDILASARDLGEQAGRGRDTQVKFLLKVVEGGYHGALDLVAHKHGDDVDDATALAEAYVKAQQGAVIFDAKAPNQRKLVSTVRLGIKLGSWSQGGSGEPLATVNALMTKRQHYKRVPDTAGIVDDAANTLLKYARFQLKREQLVPDEELDAFCFRKPRQEPTVERVLSHLLHKLDSLIEGEEGEPRYEGAAVVKARNSLRKELAKLQGATEKAAQREHENA